MKSNNNNVNLWEQTSAEVVDEVFKGGFWDSAQLELCNGRIVRRQSASQRGAASAEDLGRNQELTLLQTNHRYRTPRVLPQQQHPMESLKNISLLNLTSDSERFFRLPNRQRAEINYLQVFSFSALVTAISILYQQLFDRK